MDSISASSSLYDYLSRGFCNDCCRILRSRIDKLEASGALEGMRLPRDMSEEPPDVPTPTKLEEGISKIKASPLSGDSSRQSSDYGSVLKKGLSSNGSASKERLLETQGMKNAAVVERESDDLVGTTEGNEWKEWARMSRVGRKKDFKLVERVKGRDVNVLQGLELHTDVFNSREQEKIVNLVYRLQKLGQEGKLKERTYSEPWKWMRGKGRVTIQFGCCYNYAADKDGNPPGILREEEVDPLPPLFKLMIKRLVRWHILPHSCVPNSCIVNIYDKGDCIPPHIDHHDFLRPFCTISFLAECNILFGRSIEVLGPGEFDAPLAIPLPVGSVLILNGNGADVAKHCVPGVPAKRISITFRKMDPAKIPYNYSPDPKLQGFAPLTKPTASPPQKTNTSPPLFMPNQQIQQTALPSQITQANPTLFVPNQQAQKHGHLRHEQQRSNGSFEAVVGSNAIFNLTLKDDDFPPLGGPSTSSKRKPAPQVRPLMH